MVTEIKIGSYVIERSNRGGIRSEAYRISSEKRLVGEIPDEPGEYNIDGGVVSMGLSVDEKGHRFVDLDLGNVDFGRFLKGGKKRSVCISNSGEGHIFLPKGRVLIVTTQATPEQFKQRGNAR